MAAEIWDALPGALARGALTALVIAALLLAAQRFGRSAAGLLAGLPTVTGPALLWLALDRGEAFGASASVGAVAAGIACALFALGHALASRRHGALASLGIALAASALPLPWLAGPQWPLWLWLVLTTLVCLACQSALGVLVQVERTAAPVPCTTAPASSTPVSFETTPATSTPARAGWPGQPPPGARPSRGWLTTAAVSGLVSALAAALAGPVGPFWAGMLTSPPLLAAAVAFELHRRPGGAAETLGFLHGYVAGLLGRGLFVAAFGALLLPAGTARAFALALALSLVVGWMSGARLARHAHRPARILAGSEKRA